MIIVNTFEKDRASNSNSRSINKSRKNKIAKILAKLKGRNLSKSTNFGKV